MKRPTKNQMMMEFAYVARSRSTCSRRQVGAVLCDDAYSAISFGYNGGPAGGRNACARNDEGDCGCLHAETNAAIQSRQRPTKAFITCAPCELCAIALVNLGIKEVYYGEEYRVTRGLQVLEEQGVYVERLAP